LPLLLLLLVSGAPSADTCGQVQASRLTGSFGAIAAAEAAVYLSRAPVWWDNNPRRSFHTVWGRSANSGQSFLLHAGVAYQGAQLSNLIFDWSCVPPATSVWMAP